MGFQFNKELIKSKPSMVGQTEHKVPADLPPFRRMNNNYKALLFMSRRARFGHVTNDVIQ